MFQDDNVVLPHEPAVLHEQAQRNRCGHQPFGLVIRGYALQDDTPPSHCRSVPPVAEVHKRGIIDPVSALVMPVPARGEPTDPANCNRTLPIFDGAARFNMVLSYAATRIVEKPGYKGPVLVCNVRYVPIDEARHKLGVYADAMALDQVVRSPRAHALGWTPTLHSVAGNAARLLEEWRESRNGG